MSGNKVGVEGLYNTARLVRSLTRETRSSNNLFGSKFSFGVCSQYSATNFPERCGNVDKTPDCLCLNT